jgi:hypothetical protein
VVATSNAIEGLELVSEHEVLIGDTPYAFALQVLRLARDLGLRASIAKKARSKVAQSYHWKGVGAQIDALIAGSLARTSQGVA